MSNQLHFSPLVQEENVATPKHGATVIAGEVAPGGNLKTALLDGETKNFDMERGFTRHPIDDREDRGIVVKLGMPCIINHLRLLLWDKGKVLFCDMASREIYSILPLCMKWVSVRISLIIVHFNRATCLLLLHRCLHGPKRLG